MSETKNWLWISSYGHQFGYMDIPNRFTGTYDEVIAKAERAAEGTPGTSVEVYEMVASAFAEKPDLKKAVVTHVR